MRILSYLRELSDALEDWEKVYGVLQNDFGALKGFIKNVKELQQDGS